MSSDPFGGAAPAEPQKLPTLKFFTPGTYLDGSKGKMDTVQGRVLRIGDVFKNTAMPGQTGDPGESYPIELEMTYVSQTAVKKAGRQAAYDPPEVGDEVVYFVKLGGPADKGIKAATRAANASGVEEDGLLSIRFVEERKSKYPEPFKFLEYKYEAPVKPEGSADPWGDDAPQDEERPF